MLCGVKGWSRLKGVLWVTRRYLDCGEAVSVEQRERILSGSGVSKGQAMNIDKCLKVYWVEVVGVADGHTLDEETEYYFPFNTLLSP